MTEDDRISAALEKVRSWVSAPHRDCAICLLSGYYAPPRLRGAEFDELAGTTPANVITETDLTAVRRLSIGFPRIFVRSQLTAIRERVPAAHHITVHRVLDVIAWRRAQGHHCDGCPPAASALIGH
jgi:hypothetical protein